MKKKSLLMFLVALFIAPLSGCGEETIEVETSLRKSEGDDSDYAINDCAEIIGSGDYTVNSNITITVNYVAATCDFGNLYIEETGETISEGAYLVKTGANSDGIAQVKYTMFSVPSSRTITVTMAGKGATADTPAFKYVGMQRIYNSGLLGETSAAIDDYLFAAKTGESVITSEKPEIGDYDVTASKKLGAYMKENNSDPNPDLNFIFVATAAEPKTYEIMPYTLKWQVASMVDGVCQTYTEIEGDPNDYIPRAGTCIGAVVDQRTVSLSHQKTLLKSTVEKILTDKALISFTDKTDENAPASCTGASNTLDHSKCMYVSNIGKLTDESMEHNIGYYGFRDTGENYLNTIESINGNSLTSKRLYSAKRPTGQEDYETITVNYTTGYSDLSQSLQDMITDTNALISAIDASDNPAEIISGYGLTFYYSQTSGFVLKTFQNTTKKYDINFIKNAFVDSRIEANASANVYNYAVTFKVDDLADNIKTATTTLSEKLNSDPFNTMFKTSSTPVQIRNQLRAILTTIINTEGNEGLKVLSDYYYDIVVNATDKTLEVTPVLAASTLASAENTKSNYFVIPQESLYACKILAYTGDTNRQLTCAKEMSTSDSTNVLAIIDFIKIIAGDDGYSFNATAFSNVKILEAEEGLAGYDYIFDYTVGETTLTIKIRLAKDTKRMLTVVVGTKEYTLNVHAGENILVNSLTSTSQTVIGTIVQTYNPNEEDESKKLTTTLDGTAINTESLPVSDTIIKKLYELLTTGSAVYKVNEAYWYFVDPGNAEVAADLPQMCMIKITTSGENTTYILEYSNLDFSIVLPEPTPEA